ncbi:unnamed protein product, partial [Polarella glacialis]
EMFSLPKDVKRRCQEVFSGYARVQLRTVLEEIRSPCLATERECRLLAHPRGYAPALTTSAVSAIGVSYLARCIGVARFGH